MRSALIVCYCLLATLSLSQELTPASLRAELAGSGDKAALATRIRRWFGREITTGADARYESQDVAWALEGPRARSVFVVTDSGQRWPLARVGQSAVLAVGMRLDPGTVCRWQFEVDGAKVGPVRNLEVYAQDPYSIVRPDSPKGVLTQMPKWKSNIFDRTERDWWMYVPAQYQPEKPVCMMVFQDGQSARGYVPAVLDNLIADGEMPVTVAIFLAPGTFPDRKSNRSVEYDTLSDRYARFLLEEIIPEVKKKVNLRTGAVNWALAGVSSGGICAFTAAWERPDRFGKVMSWVGSFTNIAGGTTGNEGGHNYPQLIRRTQRKPIRIFLQDGANDLDNQFGNWWLGALSMDAALKFKGYDCQFVGGQGFHSDRHGRSILGESLKWLWRDVR